MDCGFCNTLSGFADFENSADHGLAENFNLARIPASSGMSKSVDRGYLTKFGLRRYVGGIVAITSNKTKLL